MRDLEVIQNVNRQPIFEIRRHTEDGWHLGLADNKLVVIGRGKRFEIDLTDERSLITMHKESSIPRSIKTRAELLAARWKLACLYKQFGT